MTTTTMILLVSRDVFFASKVTGTAQQLGLSAATVMSVDALRERVAADAVACVILDLGSGISPADVHSATAAVSRPLLIAFGAHVDTAALAAAKQAGFNEVLPRSRFSADLASILQRAEQ